MRWLPIIPNGRLCVNEIVHLFLWGNFVGSVRLLSIDGGDLRCYMCSFTSYLLYDFDFLSITVVHIADFFKHSFVLVD